MCIEIGEKTLWEFAVVFVMSDEHHKEFKWNKTIKKSFLVNDKMEKHSIQVNINKRVTLKRHTINYYISQINFPSHHEPLLDWPGCMYYII